MNHLKASLILGAGVLIILIGSWAVYTHQGRSGSHRAVDPGPLVDRAGVALQASYNTKEALLGIPSRLVGPVACSLRRVVSPTAVTVFCQGHAAGPQGAGGCFQVVGTYYDRIAVFAEAAAQMVPCP
ncbi:MAG: hypothetical protein ACYC9L_05615 [Sulfuricaulis sp.]